MPKSITKTTTMTTAAIVRAALEARTAAEATHVNDMIALLVGSRHERFIGDTPSNLGPLATPGNYDHKALEPLTNMHDAILERRAHEKFGSDLSVVPFQTPHEAAAGLLGDLTREEQADLARIDIYESDPPAKESKRVTLAYRDQGCGIGNRYVSESIFRIGSRHKEASLWQQGALATAASAGAAMATRISPSTRQGDFLAGLERDDEDEVCFARRRCCAANANLEAPLRSGEAEAARLPQPCDEGRDGLRRWTLAEVRSFYATRDDGFRAGHDDYCPPERCAIDLGGGLVYCHKFRVRHLPVKPGQWRPGIYPPNQRAGIWLPAVASPGPDL